MRIRGHRKRSLAPRRRRSSLVVGRGWLYCPAMSPKCIPHVPSPTFAALAIVPTPLPSPWPGRDAQAAALRERRGGLTTQRFRRRRAYGTWIGRATASRDAPLPHEFARWECRNNRSPGWRAAGRRPRRGRFVARNASAPNVSRSCSGTSTSSIGASEEAYTRLDHGAFPVDLARPIVHAALRSAIRPACDRPARSLRDRSGRRVRRAPRCSRRRRG